MTDGGEHQSNSSVLPTGESLLADLPLEDLLAVKGEQSKLNAWLLDSLAEIRSRFDTLVRHETQSSFYGLDNSTLQDYADGLDEQSRNVVKEYAQRVFDCTAERYCSLSVTKNKSSGHFLDWLETTVLPWTLTTTPGKATRWKPEAEEFLRRSRLPYWEGELYQRLSQSLRANSSLALEPEPNEKTSSVPSLGGSMTLPRLRPTVRDHLKQVKREFDEALESCVSKSIAECKGPPPLSVENSEGVLVCKMLAGIHHECDRTFEPGDLAPISTEHYQRERWEIVGDGDLFVRCFRPQVIRLAREHLKAYQEALPDRESFCNSLDEIRQHLLKHFGVRYFSQDLQAEFDEWEESAWEGETRPGLGFAGQNVATRGEASPVGRRPISEQDQRELAKIIAPHLKGEAWKTPSILEETEESRAKRRQAFVQPILDELGWSEFRWAKQAHCNPKTVEGYLSGRTIGLQKRSRSDLAKALDVEQNKLPL